MTPEEIKQRLIDEGRCKCGRKNSTGGELCRICARNERYWARKEEEFAKNPDVTPVCNICKKECEYFWITKNGVTTCTYCIKPDQVLAA